MPNVDEFENNVAKKQCQKQMLGKKSERRLKDESLAARIYRKIN